MSDSERKPALVPEHLTYTPAECARVLGVTAQSVRDQIREGNVRAISWGGRYLVPKAELERLTGEALTGADAGSARRADLVQEARGLLSEIERCLMRLGSILDELGQQAEPPGNVRKDESSLGNGARRRPPLSPGFLSGHGL